MKNKVAMQDGRDKVEEERSTDEEGRIIETKVGRRDQTVGKKRRKERRKVGRKEARIQAGREGNNGGKQEGRKKKERERKKYKSKGVVK